MTEETAKPRKVKTVPFRGSFPWILEPRETEENGVKKTRYELNMLFPPGFDETPFKAAMTAAMVEKHGADKSAWPKLKRGPKEVIRDFAEFNEASNKPLKGDWSGWKMIRCAAQPAYPPSVVGPTKDANGKFPVITDKREVYSGRWMRATVEAFYYARKDGKGLTFGLLNVQLLKHDTKFGGAVSDPNADFDNASEEWAGNDDNWGDETPGTTETKKPAEASPDWD